MINLVVKYFVNLLIISAYFTWMNTTDVFFHLGCYTSIVFGFMLRLSQIRKRVELTRTLVIWHGIATISLCWLAFVAWRAWWTEYHNYLMVYLFGCSFFAVVISEIIDTIGKISIKEFLKGMARKWLSIEDKEGEK